MGKKRILLKLTGEILFARDKSALSATKLNQVIDQIKKLASTHQFGIVVGGGNFFRGRQHGKKLGMTASVGHQVGMLATMMNGLILKDLFEQRNMHTSLFCAIPCPEIGAPTSQQAILSAMKREDMMVFTGGTGNPFFTTDTNAVLRGLQIEADEVWKGTSVDGVYDADPAKNSDAKLLREVTYKQALDMKLGIMDATAFALAGEHKQIIRVFNIFKKDALINAAKKKDFGSIIR